MVEVRNVIIIPVKAKIRCPRLSSAKELIPTSDDLDEVPTGSVYMTLSSGRRLICVGWGTSPAPRSEMWKVRQGAQRGRDSLDLAGNWSRLSVCRDTFLCRKRSVSWAANSDSTTPPTLRIGLDRLQKKAARHPRRPKIIPQWLKATLIPEHLWHD